jgi:hypothetical protein
MHRTQKVAENPLGDIYGTTLTELICALIAGRTPVLAKNRPYCLRFFKDTGKVDPCIVTYGLLIVSLFTQKRMQPY